MKTIVTPAAALLLAALCAPSYAQLQYSQEDIIGRIADCMKETAPKDWTRLTFKLDQDTADPENPGNVVASHKAVVKGEKAAQDIKPCRRPDWVSRAVQTFRETQDEKARQWTGITVTLERNGRYMINYRYPKSAK